MLNKLLKRCMPWMDKGRWYHVRFEGDFNSEYSVKHDSIFSNYDITGGSRKFLNLYFADPAPKMCIIDTKVIAHISAPVFVLDSSYFSFEIEALESGYRMQIPLEEGLTYLDYWFFIEG